MMIGWLSILVHSGKLGQKEAVACRKSSLSVSIPTSFIGQELSVYGTHVLIKNLCVTFLPKAPQSDAFVPLRLGRDTTLGKIN